MGHDEREDDSLSRGVDSAIRDGEVRARQPEYRPKYLFARISVLLIMLMWVVAGIAKVMDMSAFVDVIDQHRIIPEDLQSLMVWVGPAELVMGLMLVFVAGSELRKPFGKLVLVFSMACIGGFMYYLSLVDPVVLQESGCGCLSDYRIASGMEDSVRFFAMGRNTILVILHIVALFGPAMIDSRHRSAMRRVNA